MEIIVVEDEPKIRDGIVNMIEKHTEHKVTAVAENGIEGVRLVCEKKPDLLISDIRMPGMSGLDMARDIRQKGLQTSVIFLTGYSEFEYARDALQLHAVDYILKPVDVDYFLAAIQNVEDRLRQTKTEQISPEQMLWLFINGGKEERDRIRKKLGDRLGVSDRVQLSLFYVEPDDQTTETFHEMMYETRRCMEDQCIRDYYLVPLEREKGYIAVIVDTEKNHFLKWVFANRIVPDLLNTAGFRCSFGRVFGLDELGKTISGLQSLLLYSFHLTEGTIVDQTLADGISFESLEYPAALEDCMQKEIWRQDKEKIYKIGDSFAEQIIRGNGHPDEIREYTIRFSAGMLKTAAHMASDAEQEQYMLSSMFTCRTEEHLIYRFEKILKFVSGEQQKVDITDNDLILKVIAFVRDNYTRDLSLSEAADICGVSAEYLCRLFQQETGVKFTAFIQNFRISTAKRLLVSDERKIYEIAEAVGYHDQKYFISVFKKLCGVTPSVYRKERRL